MDKKMPRVPTVPRFSDLSHRKKQLLRLMLEGQSGIDSGQRILPRNEDVQEPPLSHVQERMWFLSQLPDTTPYPNNLPSAVRLKGSLDIAALQQAFKTIVGRHEALRTTFPIVSGKPVQRIAPFLDIPIPVKDLCHLSTEDREAAFYAEAKTEIRRLFDLAQESPIRICLYRLAQDDHLLLLIAHHIIWDGWSIGILTGELARFYEAFSRGATPDAPPPVLQYADFALWQRQHLTGGYLTSLVSFWQQTLADAPELALPLDYPRPEAQNFQGAMEAVIIEEEITAGLTQLSRDHDATLFMTLVSAFSLLLFKYSGNPAGTADRIVLGSPTANRRQKEIENIIGCFANIFVLNTDMSGNPTFEELLSRVKSTVLDAQAHQDLPFEMMVEHLNIRHDPGKNPLFQVMFGLHKTSLNELTLPGMTLSSVPMDSDTTHFDLGLHLWIQERTLSGYFSYRTDLFSKATIQGILSHFHRILAQVLADSDRRLSKIDLLTRSEKALMAVSHTVVEQNPAHLYHLFETMAARHPHATALVLPKGRIDETGQEILSLSYSDLKRKVDGFAGKLTALFPGPELKVGVRLTAGPECVVAILGILKVGGSVVPLDPSLPQTVTADLANALDINLVVLESAEGLPSCKATLPMFFSAGIMSDGIMSESPDDTDLPAPEQSTFQAQPAFILGSPENGIRISHGRMIRQINTLQAEFSLSIQDTMIFTCDTGKPSLAWEILWPLLTGACLAISESDQVIGTSTEDGGSRRLIHLTPEDLPLREDILPSDQVLVSGGPPPSKIITDRFIQKTGAQVTYVYAPPEAAFGAGFMDCREKISAVRLSPAAGVRILDQFHQPVPFGVPGDVYLDARGLSSVNGHEWPADPLSEPPEGFSGRRLVKTGDRGRLREDNTLQLLESSGESIWKDGMRFHPGTVEAALLRHPLVSDCRVAQTRKGLTAFTVTQGAVNRIHKHLSAYLHKEMIPGRFLPVNQLPLTQTGYPDDAGLSRMDVLDEAAAEQWESAIQAIPEVDRVKVFWKDTTPPCSHIHVSDLLPERKSSESPASDTALLGACIEPEDPSPAMAFSDGGPLDIPGDAPKTLGRALVKIAETRGDLGIIVVQQETLETFISYADLLKTGERILAGLQAGKLGPGDSVILQLEDMAQYFCAFWACMLGGIIPVTIAVDTTYTEKSGVVKKLWNSWKLLDCPPVIADTATAERLSGVPGLFRDESGSAPFTILPYEKLQDTPGPALIHEGRPEDVAFHQLTSGSTGIPKCVQITNSGAIHYIFGALSFGNTDRDISLNWLPMDHVVPLLTCHLKDVYLGNQQLQVHPRLVLANPLLWLDLMDKHRVTYTWAPNFGFKLLTDALEGRADRTWDLTPLQFLLTGGEQITLPVIADIHRQLVGFGMDPDAMRSGYGMAEIGTVAVHPNVLKPASSADRFLKSSLNGILQETDKTGDQTVVFMNLGPARAGVQFRIVDDVNCLLPEKRIGNLQVRGGIVTPGYLNNDAVNREAFSEDGWFNTGDCAFIRNGVLTITGRVKETIIICGANYYCYEIEDIVNDIPGVTPTFSAAVAVDNPRMGSESLAIFFVPRADEKKVDDNSTANENPANEEDENSVDITVIRAIRDKVGKELGISPESVIPLTQKTFPKTTSGKIQRTDLKKGLDQGDFNHIIKQIDLAAESRNTVPEWFFEKVWIPKAATVHPVDSAGTYLVFTKDTPLFNRLAEQQPGRHIRVEPGDEYRKISRAHYTVRITEQQDYERLLSDLACDGITVSQIFHLLSYKAHENHAVAAVAADAAAVMAAMDHGVRSLLCLYRALSELTVQDRPGHWLVAGSQLMDVLPDDDIALESATIQGLMNVLAQELPGMNCRLLDLPQDTPDAAVPILIREAAAHGDRMTAYREGKRFIPKLKKIKFAPLDGTVFKPGGVVLISGGLGGVGVEIARFLLAEYGSRLILVGKTPIDSSLETPQEERAASPSPHENDLDADAAALAGTVSVADRLVTLRELEKLGGEVVYEAADVGNFQQMESVKARAFERWGTEISGIIHLAGVFPTRMLVEETVESFDHTLYPKVKGALVLESLLPEQGFFIGFSSLFSFFGGLAVGAYSAANAFLEGFCHHLRRHGRPESYCFSWTVWDETGMSRGFQLKDQSRAHGYQQIPAQRGIVSLMAGLHSRHHSPYIGLDASKPLISAAIHHPECRLTQSLTAAYTTKDGKPCQGCFRMLTVRDPQGKPTSCEFAHLAEMPQDKSGNIDLKALRKSGAGPAGKGRTSPRTGYEKNIEAIWQEVLDLEDFGIHDTFFELGGQSILLVRTQTKLQQMFNRDISIVELLRYPTISTLAKYLEEGKKQQNFDAVKSRAKRLKQKRTRRPQPKGRLRPARRIARRGE